MKSFKMFVIISLVLLMAMSTTITVSAATGRKAYGEISYGCKNYLNPVKDKAWSSITYNGDKPVDNYLSVSMNVQYQKGNTFYWEDPLEDYGANRSEASVERWRYSLMAIETSFYARSAGCDTYSDTVTDHN